MRGEACASRPHWEMLASSLKNPEDDIYSFTTLLALESPKATLARQACGIFPYGVGVRVLTEIVT